MANQTMTDDDEDYVGMDEPESEPEGMVDLTGEDILEGPEPEEKKVDRDDEKNAEAGQAEELELIDEFFTVEGLQTIADEDFEWSKDGAAVSMARVLLNKIYGMWAVQSFNKEPRYDELKGKIQITSEQTKFHDMWSNFIKFVNGAIDVNVVHTQIGTLRTAEQHFRDFQVGIKKARNIEKKEEYAGERDFEIVRIQDLFEIPNFLHQTADLYRLWNNFLKTSPDKDFVSEIKNLELTIFDRFGQFFYADGYKATRTGKPAKPAKVIPKDEEKTAEWWQNTKTDDKRAYLKYLFDDWKNMWKDVFIKQLETIGLDETDDDITKRLQPVLEGIGKKYNSGSNLVFQLTDLLMKKTGRKGEHQGEEYKKLSQLWTSKFGLSKHHDHPITKWLKANADNPEKLYDIIEQDLQKIYDDKFRDGKAAVVVDDLPPVVESKDSVDYKFHRTTTEIGKIDDFKHPKMYDELTDKTLDHAINTYVGKRYEYIDILEKQTDTVEGDRFHSRMVDVLYKEIGKIFKSGQLFKKTDISPKDLDSIRRMKSYTGLMKKKELKPIIEGLLVFLKDVEGDESNLARAQEMSIKDARRGMSDRVAADRTQDIDAVTKRSELGKQIIHADQILIQFKRELRNADMTMPDNIEKAKEVGQRQVDLALMHAEMKRLSKQGEPLPPMRIEIPRNARQIAHLHPTRYPSRRLERSVSYSPSDSPTYTPSISSSQQGAESEEKAPSPRLSRPPVRVVDSIRGVSRAHPAMNPPRPMMAANLFRGPADHLAHGVASEEEKQEERQRFNHLVGVVGSEVAQRDFEYDRYSKQFRLKQHDRLRVHQPIQSHFLRRRHNIIGAKRHEMVYIKEPSRRSTTFLNIDPRIQFANNMYSDPISVTHQNQWGRIGQYFNIAAKPYAVHITVLKKLTDHARELLLTRILEHAKSKDVRNPRLVGVFKRGSKKLVRAIFNSNQLRNEKFEALLVRLKKEIRRMKHLILRQDSAGGKFHQRVVDNDLL